MDLAKLNKILEKEPTFRKDQARKAVFQEFVDSWQEVKTLPLDLRGVLDKECTLKIDVQATISQDEKTIKALITLKDNLKIETVLMRNNDDRNTVCVSSQVGCPLGCSFCATGKLGFKRNLTSLEIVEQVLFFARYLKTKKAKVTNIVFMGMGEPFLNYDNVWGAVKIFNDAKYFNIGVRSISISTAGIIEGIKRLQEENLHVNLAISLHAPNDELRKKLMPIDKKYPLPEVLKAVDEYIEKTKRKVMFEYVLIKDINDSGEDAVGLAKIMNKKLYFVNLILYNDTGIYKASETKRVEAFRAILEKLKIRYTQRYRFGDDIEAACGQFIIKK